MGKKNGNFHDVVDPTQPNLNLAAISVGRYVTAHLNGPIGWPVKTALASMRLVHLNAQWRSDPQKWPLDSNLIELALRRRENYRFFTHLHDVR